MGDAKVVVEFFFLSYIIPEILGREFFFKANHCHYTTSIKTSEKFFFKKDWIFFVCVKIDKRGEISCIELIAGVGKPISYK